MTQSSSGNTLNELQVALTPILRQLDRLEDRLENRTQNLVTRADLDLLRKELVARDTLEPHLNDLRAQIMRVNEDRLADKKEMKERIDTVENRLLSRQELLAMRLAGIAGIGSLLLALLQYLSHVRVGP